MPTIYSRLGDRGKRRVLRLAKVVAVLVVSAGSYYCTCQLFPVHLPALAGWNGSSQFYVLVSKDKGVQKPMLLRLARTEPQGGVEVSQGTDKDVLSDMNMPLEYEAYIAREDLPGIQEFLTNEFFHVPSKVQLSYDDVTQKQTIRITRFGEVCVQWEYCVAGHRIENPRYGEMSRWAMMFASFRILASALLVAGVIAVAAWFTYHRRKLQPVETEDLWATKWWEQPRRL